MVDNKKILIAFLFFISIFLFTNSAYSAPSLSLIYVIQQGDTLSEIADEYEVSIEKIKNKNNIKNGKNIKMGDELVIPFDVSLKDSSKNNNDFYFNKYTPEKSELSFSVNTHYAARINPGQQLPDVDDIPKDKIIKYNVGPGDTLYDLARDFSTTIGTILALNNKESSALRTGERIKIPIHNLTPHQVLNKRVSKQELDLLARAVYGESRGEPYLGQVAVAAVIINRILSPKFPDTFAEVIYQQGQFSIVENGQINLTPNQTAYRAARDALKGKDPTNGALYFYNPRTATRVEFFQGRRVITKIGNHLFVE